MKKHYGLTLSDKSALVKLDAVIVAVAHDEYRKLSMTEMDKLFGEGTKVLADVTDNARRMFRLVCEETDIKALRLIMTEANCGGETMRLFSFEAR